jgi:hypothetical protein
MQLSVPKQHMHVPQYMTVSQYMTAMVTMVRPPFSCWDPSMALTGPVCGTC